MNSIDANLIKNGTIGDWVVANVPDKNVGELISRKALVNALTNWQMGYAEKDEDDERFETLGAVIELVEQMPSVEPKKVVEDYCRPRNLMVVTAEYFHGLVEQMLQTIDVPDRKFGEWETEVRTIRGHKIAFFACSVCGRNADDEYPYCPNCGARMSDECAD